eukprot:248209-Amphidinium_carterae.1
MNGRHYKGLAKPGSYDGRDETKFVTGSTKIKTFLHSDMQQENAINIMALNNVFGENAAA